MIFFKFFSFAQRYIQSKAIELLLKTKYDPNNQALKSLQHEVGIAQVLTSEQLSIVLRIFLDALRNDHDTFEQKLHTGDIITEKLIYYFQLFVHAEVNQLESQQSRDMIHNFVKTMQEEMQLLV